MSTKSPARLTLAERNAQHAEWAARYARLTGQRSPEQRIADLEARLAKLEAK